MKKKILISVGIILIVLGVLVFWPAKTEKIVNSEGDILKNIDNF